MEMEESQALYADPLILSPCSRGCRRGTRRNSQSNSPEFEFWMTRNPSFPQPNLLSADELFSGGVILPLHLLHLHAQPPQDTEILPSGRSEPEFGNSSDNLSASSMLTPSKRWKDIFKKSDKKSSFDDNANVDNNNKDKDNNIKDKKREKKNSGCVGASKGNISTAELNIINIWPFSRSRSAGNGGTRPRVAATTRKVSSAPCSRSNSAGESKARKWPSSPSRTGVHLGKSSPVWHASRSGGGRSSCAVIKSTAQKGVKKDRNEDRRKIKTAVSSSGGGGNKGKVLNFNVPVCIGYRHHLSCRGDENSAIGVATAAARGGGHSQYGGGGSSEGVRGRNLFDIRSLFTKKVY